MTGTSPRLLADESCDFAVVRRLREAGYDVLAVSEYTSRSIDDEVIALAAGERRVLLTEDKDFGWLVYAANADSAGVILIRYPGNARSTLPDAVIRLVRDRGNELERSFVVMQPGYIRFSRQRG